MPEGWRTLWQHRYDGGVIDVAAGAIAVLDGQTPLVVVTEEWSSGLIGLLHCDNTQVYHLADGAKQGSWIMYKYPFEHPRIDVYEGTAVVNTGRGLERCGGLADSATVELETLDWHAVDLVTGRVDDRAVVAAAWDPPLEGDEPHLRLYDLTTGQPWGEPIPPPEAAVSEWHSPSTWRLGRWDGQPVLGHVEDSDLLFVYSLSPSGLDGPKFIYLVGGAPPGPWADLLFTIDDRCGPTVALVPRDDGVYCYDLDEGEEYRPPLTAMTGRPTAGRLGRWRGRQVAAVLTDTGLSLFDLRDVDWVRHLELGRPVHDVAFTATGELALITTTGPMLIEPLD